MSATGNANGPIDLQAFWKNWAKFPQEQLVPYWGKQVAWSGDGTRILASADSSAELYDKVRALGIRTDQVVFGHVDDPNLVQI